MPIEAVIFDLDGTLVDSGATVPAAYAAAIEELCGRRCTDEEIIAAYSAGPAPALISRFTGRLSACSDVDCWLRHLEARLALTRVYPGVREAGSSLRAAGKRLAVFTGAIRRAAEMQLRHAGLDDAIDAVVGSDEIALVKPAPDGIFLACDRLGVDPGRVAYVGDALNDLRCARAAGAVPIAAAWGHLFESDDEPHLIALTPHDLLPLVGRAA